ncbi:MAG TPA: hypothetical protein VJR92_03975, partial [Gemmatimonadaceae bacterium]|nr:hypothetical protein [Gemmatimonadaceae bacterium]
ERAQAEINARLTREIHASGAAGAGVFAIIDEWFKKNWLAIDFEQPAERKRLWLNALDAEQNYGVIAMRAGHRDSAIVIDGDARDWRDAKPLLESGAPGSVPSALQLQSLHVKHDEAYVYLRLTTGAIDWTQARYLIGVDTYRGDLGDTRMPFTNSRTATGLEFVVDLRGPAGSRVLVDSPYNPFRLRAITGARPPARQMTLNAPFRTVANADGRFDSALVIPNRRRIGRDGTFYAEQVHDRGALTYARQQETTLADWYADAATGTIELRIPWGLLNVLDPSSRHVLFGQTTTKYPSGATTDGFRFYVESYDPRNPAVPGDRLPKSAQGTFTNAPLWTWPTWEAPRWYAEVKPLFAAMRDAFSAIPRSGEPRPSLAR